MPAAGLLLVVLGFSGTAKAALTTKEIPGRIVVETQAHPGPNDPGRCVAATFVEFSEVKGATSYSAFVRGAKGSHDVHGSGPPFPDDRFSDFPAMFIAPGGSHRFVLGS